MKGPSIHFLSYLSSEEGIADIFLQFYPSVKCIIIIFSIIITIGEYYTANQCD